MGFLILMAFGYAIAWSGDRYLLHRNWIWPWHFSFGFVFAVIVMNALIYYPIYDIRKNVGIEGVLKVAKKYDVEFNAELKSIPARRVVFQKAFGKNRRETNSEIDSRVKCICKNFLDCSDIIFVYASNYNDFWSDRVVLKM